LYKYFRILSTSVSEKHAASFFRVKGVFCIEDWSNKFLSAISQKAGKLMPTTVRI
jgi:hypothetical protein